MRLMLSILFGLLLAVSTAHAASVTVSPSAVMQGEPVLVIFEDAQAGAVSALSYNGKRLPVFSYNGKPSALVGIDLKARVGTSTIVAMLTNGRSITEDFLITPRPKVTAPLGIPEKLGGNTEEAQNNLVRVLAKENARLAQVKSSAAPFWTKGFIFPVKNPTVTDSYGYLRKTGYYDIPHKGSDFHADIGTKVLAIQSGVVRLVREFTVYGKTVVIDHGAGVLSLYMHLSKLNVKEGQKVKQGQAIGLSGESGYALEPHLHLSIRIGGISIDPMKFFSLLGSHSSR